MITSETLSAAMPAIFSASATGFMICPVALLRHGLIEAGVDDDGAVLAHDRPNEEVERLRRPDADRRR